VPAFRPLLFIGYRLHRFMYLFLWFVDVNDDNVCVGSVFGMGRLQPMKKIVRGKLVFHDFRCFMIRY
jgi:hypothetical protein